MRKTNLILAACWLLLICFAIGLWQGHTTVYAQSSGQKWEYAQVSYDPKAKTGTATVDDKDAAGNLSIGFMAVYNENNQQPTAINYLSFMGGLGWELVDNYEASDGEIVFTFKRPL